MLPNNSHTGTPKALDGFFSLILKTTVCERGCTTLTVDFCINNLIRHIKEDSSASTPCYGIQLHH